MAGQEGCERGGKEAGRLAGRQECNDPMAQRNTVSTSIKQQILRMDNSKWPESVDYHCG